MIILGIDSSSVAASVGIMKDDKTLINFTLNHQRTHSEKLLPMIDSALLSAKLSLKEIDRFAVCIGPGSFTGLRIGLATIKAFCQAHGKKAYLTSSLSALYESAGVPEEDPILVCPIIDAGRGEVYTALFSRREKILTDCALPFSKLLLTLKEKEQRVLFTGDGVPVFYKEAKEALGSYASFAPEHLLYGSGGGVIRAALKENRLVDYPLINPVYLKVSQAERLRNEKIRREESL